MTRDEFRQALASQEGYADFDEYRRAVKFWKRTGKMPPPRPRFDAESILREADELAAEPDVPF